MASPTWWTWFWVNSGSWWWTRRPSMLQNSWGRKVRHDWATELNWTTPTHPDILECEVEWGLESFTASKASGDDRISAGINLEYSLEEHMLKLKVVNTLGTLWEEVNHKRRPWCWERFKVGGKWDDRGWDCWMESLTQWTWIWASFRIWCKTERLPFCSPQGPKSWTQLKDWTELMEIRI